MNMIKDLLNTPFMQMPAWRWFIFLGLILSSLVIWRGVLDEMS